MLDSATSNSGGSNISYNLELQQKQIKMGDRVMAFDNGGGTVYGTVKWISHKFIGIETVSIYLCLHT